MATVGNLKSNPINDAFLAADPDTQTQMVLKEFGAAYSSLESGALEQYCDNFVAFLDGKLVGSDPNQVILRSRVSAEQNVHPERMAIIHVDGKLII